MGERVFDGDAAAHRIAGEHKPVEPELRCYPFDIAGEGDPAVVVAAHRAGKPVAALIEADHPPVALQPLGPRLPGVQIGIRTMKQDNGGGIARPFVAQVHGDAVIELDELGRRAAVLGAHRGGVGIRNAEDEKGHYRQRGDNRQALRQPLH